jgi:hypothetical protein
MHRHVKKLWTHDIGLTALLIMLFIQIFVLYPFETSAIGQMLVHLIFMLILISGMMTVVGTPVWGRLTLVLGSVSLVCRALTYTHSGLVPQSLNPLMTAFFSAVLIIVIILQVFREGPINAHRISGAICVYLLVGLFWGSLYVLIDLQWPGAFSYPQLPASLEFHSRAGKLYYFSFITLTSVGYGDVLPVHSGAQTLAMLEAVVGQLFPAILIARLVSMEIEDRQGKRRRSLDSTED